MLMSLRFKLDLPSKILDLKTKDLELETKPSILDSCICISLKGFEDIANNIEIPDTKIPSPKFI